MTRAWAILVVIVLVPVAGCAGGGDPSSPTPPRSPYADLYQRLCQTRAQATQPVAARETFFDRVHQPLHECRQCEMRIEPIA